MQVRNIYDFDDRFTAQAFAFGSADNYYATQSSNQFLDRIRVPTLVVQAKDDPLIPFAVYDHPAFSTNPYLRLLAIEHGGHLGFISKTKPRFWLDQVLVNWVLEVRNNVSRPVSSLNIRVAKCKHKPRPFAKRRPSRRIRCAPASCAVS